MKTLSYKKGQFVTITLTIFVLITFLLIKDRIVINTSASIPLGIYSIRPTIASLKQYDFVGICLDKQQDDFGLSRGYILAGRRCYGSSPLLKSIIAVPGDDVTLTNDDIIVNGKTYYYPTQNYDSKHRMLPSWTRGNYYKTSGFWVIGTNSKNSWDSRYFGPINHNQIIYIIRPFIT